MFLVFLAELSIGDCPVSAALVPYRSGQCYLSAFLQLLYSTLGVIF